VLLNEPWIGRLKVKYIWTKIYAVRYYVMSVKHIDSKIN
jgi:hypothetical protein